MKLAFFAALFAWAIFTTAEDTYGQITIQKFEVTDPVDGTYVSWKEESEHPYGGEVLTISGSSFQHCSFTCVSHDPPKSVLRDYFAGEASVASLRADLVGAVVITDPQTRSHRMVDMSADFELRRAHLVRLCDDVLARQLEPDDLQAIGFCLVASDHFTWD